MSYREAFSQRRIQAASDTTLSRKGEKLPLCRNANEGTELADESVPRRSEPPQLLYRCCVELPE